MATAIRVDNLQGGGIRVTRTTSNEEGSSHRDFFFTEPEAWALQSQLMRLPPPPQDRRGYFP